MRYRVLLLTILLAGIVGMVNPASAGYRTNYYNLDRTMIEGTVESIDGRAAFILTNDGQEIGVQLGPQSYWDSRGYYLQEGDYVQMEVWYDPDGYTDWYFAGEIWGDGFHYVFANNYGVPYWVLYRDDYYYGLGYRASCVSFMVWYDLPPVYFVYLSLPPPPPRYYTCYYGPQWRYHYSDWCYGPRYASGGSYWRDGRGYERPGRRGGYSGGPRGYIDPNSGGSGTWRPDPRPLSTEPTKPVTPPRPGPRGRTWDSPQVSPQPRVAQPAPKPRRDPPQVRNQDRWQSRPEKPQMRQDRTYQRPTPGPRSEPRYRERTAPQQQPERGRYERPAPVTPRQERNWRTAPAPRERQQVQPRPVAPPSRPNYQPRPVKQEVREQKAPQRDARQVYRAPQGNTQRSNPQVSPQYRGNGGGHERGHGRNSR